MNGQVAWQPWVEHERRHEANDASALAVLVPSWARVLRERGPAVALACIESYLSPDGFATIRPLPREQAMR